MATTDVPQRRRTLAGTDTWPPVVILARFMTDNTLHDETLTAIVGPLPTPGGRGQEAAGFRHKPS
jgi:hypothetical protein